MDKDVLFEIETAINQIAPGLGYTCFLFQFDTPQYASYITNARRSDIIKSLKNTVKHLEETDNEDLFIRDDRIYIDNYSFVVR